MGATGGAHNGRRREIIGPHERDLRARGDGFAGGGVSPLDLGVGLADGAVARGAIGEQAVGVGEAALTRGARLEKVAGAARTPPTRQRIEAALQFSDLTGLLGEPFRSRPATRRR